MKESIYETYARTVCANCNNKKNCIEELRIKSDNTIKCKNYERKIKNEN